ncbi:DUF1554 domain-containing protein, partial [Candidatus Daviesbacteria bacterium]|nr:DUF1554 domain-containing protein [Candidatus Daviesbacteria bacterium]
TQIANFSQPAEKIVHQPKFLVIFRNFLADTYQKWSEIDASFPLPSPGATPTPTPTPVPIRVFITSTNYNGNLGGVAGADAKCQTAANSASLGGTWKAWISESAGNSPSVRFNSTSSYRNSNFALLNGTVIANNWTDLTDGSIQNPINRTENNALAASSRVWTSTNPDGTHNSSGSCSNWTSSLSSFYGFVGHNSLKDNGWSFAIAGDECILNDPLYCFEQ